MKKVILLVFFLICAMFTEHNKEFAKTEYDAVDIIAENEDRSVKKEYVISNWEDEVSFTAQKFDGRETVWQKKYEESQNVEGKLMFTLTAGKAKLVHIDQEGNVTTIAECAPDSGIKEMTPCTIPMKEGKNRLKMVGYGCQDIDFQLELELVQEDEGGEQ